jgi:predicted DNA-binding transcriptional regulator YafY
MYHPTTRVLTVLELLQARPHMSGKELAERLEVSPRTVRRYVTMLQDMGIPVEAERGRHGAYRLMPGYKLPPLMFSEDEALALTLSLQVARRLSLPVDETATEGALAKVERVMPEKLRVRVQAVQAALVVNATSRYAAPASTVVTTFSTAAQSRRRIHIHYEAWNNAATEREVDPYGVVYYSGRWFGVGYCHLRQAVRTFRLDRVRQATLLSETFTAPDNFDALAQVIQSLASAPGEWAVEVLLKLSLAEAQHRVPPEMATLEAIPEGVILRCNVQELNWLGWWLVGLECPLVVRRPVELRDVLRQWAERAAHLAQAG